MQKRLYCGVREKPADPVLSTYQSILVGTLVAISTGRPQRFKVSKKLRLFPKAKMCVPLCSQAKMVVLLHQIRFHLRVQI